MNIDIGVLYVLALIVGMTIYYLVLLKNHLDKSCNIFNVYAGCVISLSVLLVSKLLGYDISIVYGIIFLAVLIVVLKPTNKLFRKFMTNRILDK